MNIGVDATCWWNRRGFGRMARELLSAMFALHTEHVFYLFIDQTPDKSMDLPNLRLVQVFPDRPLTDAAVANDRRSIGSMLKLYKAVSRSPLDIMFFPAVYSWFPVPLSLPTIVTLHDAIPEHFPEMVFPHWKGRLFWSMKIKLALWQCRRVMTVSQAAKREIAEYIGVKTSLIDVISEAPDAIFQKIDNPESCRQMRQRHDLPQNAKLIVYVGGLAPHKNLHGFLEGFAVARQYATLDDVHIVLVGDYNGAGFHSNYPALKQLSEDDRLKGYVHFTGFMSDQDLVVLYNDAWAAAMPSFSEGFGLPAMEAMACGTPVLSSNRASLPEVIGDTGVYFDPCDIESISQAIITLSTDPELRQRLSERALTRASSYTWESAAQLALGYLESLSSEPGKHRDQTRA